MSLQSKQKNILININGRAQNSSQICPKANISAQVLYIFKQVTWVQKSVKTFSKFNFEGRL